MNAKSIILIVSSLIVAVALYTAANYYDDTEAAYAAAKHASYTASLEPTEHSNRAVDEEVDQPAVQKNGTPDIRMNIEHSGATKQQYSATGGGTAEDQRILNDIGEALKSSYSRFNLNIYIDNGVVTIKGVVKSTNDILDIQNTILRIRGVKSVHNQLSALNKTSQPQQRKEQSK